MTHRPVVGVGLLFFMTVLVSCQSNPSPLTPQPLLQPEKITAPAETQVPTQSPPPHDSPTQKPVLEYAAQSGETLAILADRFGVSAGEINLIGNNKIATTEMLNPGILMAIPDVLGHTSPGVKLISDSHIVYSPQVADINPGEYIRAQDGFFSTYISNDLNAMPESGEKLLVRIALENSINPQLLIALLEYRCGCILGELNPDIEPGYLVGINQWPHEGLYRQLLWLVNQLNAGYYGWRAGSLTELIFPMGDTLRINPTLNAGTVALQYLFSQLYDREEWHKAIDTDTGFINTYVSMFATEQAFMDFTPFYPKDLTQPNFILPFIPGHTWSFTGGPHSAWEKLGPEAAIDFAPMAEEPNCDVSEEWVTAMASGVITRLEPGFMLLDLDEDENEHTGWVILYLHLTWHPKFRVGQHVAQDTLLGHPSCEGGRATGTHLHIARRYNGEWILAGGPLPFNLGGWQVGDLPEFYKGTLTKNSLTITSCTCAIANTYIKRPRE
ncbi:MAG: M23 family metallopeptidase [Chloroflexota bacterium]